MYPFASMDNYGQQFGLYGGATYGTLTLTDASPAQTFAQPLDTDETMKFLGLELDDENRDMVEGFIKGALVQAEICQNRDLMIKQCDLSRDYWPLGPTWRQTWVELRAPLVSVDLVKYQDSNGTWTTLTEGTDYIVDASKQPGIIAPPYNHWWPLYTPWPSSSLLIRFTSGMAPDSQFWTGEHGSNVLIGMKMLVRDWFDNRNPRVLGRGETLAMPFAGEDPITLLLSSGALPRAVR